MASQTFTFIVSIPDQEPVRHELEGDKITFGRGPDNGIQVLVSEVSVKHGEFVAEDDGHKIVDNGSTNGTKVNGTRVDSSGKKLEPMDKIVLGETIDCYYVPSAVLESTDIPELIKNIESSPKAGKTGTAPVAIAAPAAGGAAPAPVKPAPVAPGGAKPAPVAPGGVKPAPVKPAAPMQPAAANPGASTVKLDQVRPSGGGGPAQPPGAPPAPGGVKPPPAAPSGGAPAPQPVSPTPLKRPDAPQPAAPPKIPLPGKKEEKES